MNEFKLLLTNHYKLLKVINDNFDSNKKQTKPNNYY